ncbi:MAG: type I methionyl aminopeptidase [Candidatus Hydrogenedentes bacterium]|nr:type I methionyl aminopeptidase [Candidatus Hydrogenedentota bacterium]
MIAIKSEHEIAIMREANQIVAEVLVTLAGMVAPGVSTGALDEEAARLIRAYGAKPSFLGYLGYPKNTCISVDEQIIHGIPGKRKLMEGQIVSIDVGVKHHGYYGDAAVTVACGKIDETRQRLMDATDLALSRAIAAAKHGNYLSDVSRAVQTTCEAAGFSVVRSFVGHGIGTAMHEEPQVPNFVTREKGPMLKTGMVIAIEPMVNVGTYDVRVLKDGWTAVTADGKPSAHFEHSVVVREAGGEILSATPKLVWGRRTN